MIKFIVASAYGKEAVLCEKYKDKLTGQGFEDFIKRYVKENFGNIKNAQRKMVL